LLQAEAKQLDLSEVLPAYLQLIIDMRNAGIEVSDRAAVKYQNLIAASALIAGRKQANLSDLWVMRHVWNNELQIELLTAMVDKCLADAPKAEAHPQAFQTPVVDAESLAQQFDALGEQLDKSPSHEQLARIKDQLRSLQSSSSWVQDAQAQAFLQEKIEQLWERLLKD